MQIAVEYVLLLGLLLLLSVSRWYYWLGRYETLEETRYQEPAALRKRLKANARLLSSLESQLQQWQVWARGMIQAETTDACDDTDSENAAETPDDGG